MQVTLKTTRQFTFWNTTVFACLVACMLAGCSTGANHGRSVSSVTAYPRILEKAKDDKRYLIMHSGLDTFAITSLLVEKEKKEFTVHLNKIDSVHRIHFKNPKALSEKQAHVYMRDSVSYTLDEPHTLPISKIARVELID